MLYSPDDTADNGPLTIRVFGSTDGASWSVLRNLNGDASVPIPIDPAHDPYEVTGTTTFGLGELVITQPDNNAHSWDTDGNNYFFVTVERAYDPTGSSGSDAYLQARIV
jgi:hypothetical protein